MPCKTQLIWGKSPKELRQTTLSDRPKGLIQTVGSNPLPLLISAATLKPEKSIMLYSRQTESVTERLYELYKNLGIKSKKVLIEDPKSTEECAKVVTPDMGDYHLDYTGGTKVMSCGVRSKWLQHGGTPDRCCYVDNRSEELRFDDGETVPINLLITLDTKIKLHGFELLEKRPELGRGPKLSDGAVIAQEALKGDFNSYKSKLGRIAAKVPMDSSDTTPLKPNDFGLKLSQNQIHPKMKSITRSTWKDFFKGKWLEYWIAYLIAKLEKEEPMRIHAGVSVGTAGGGSFELDVIGIRRHKTYVISCTTDSKPSEAKMKLFEVYMRARQMGGTLARSAIVAGLDWAEEGDGSIHDRVEDLEEVARRAWDSPNSPKVFGLRHMREWAGIGISEPNLSSLKKWLSR
ncbi:MAG: hypothetical protein GF309_08635 [Candidatus Lokiarchaeota archaeon]|nr:hypothetical protein [Candidatus Lokiarchaeota archaeon]